MKVKSKKPHWYNILIIPQGSSSMRKLQVPRWVIPAFFGFVSFCTLVTLSVFGAALYYRSGWLATADVRVQNESLQQATAEMSKKLESLEELADRTSHLASTLEGVVGINKKGLSKGIGPISDEGELPTAKSVASFKNYNLGEDDENGDVAFKDLSLKMDKLNEELANVEMRLSDVYQYHNDKLTYWSSIPSIWPVRGWVTSGFGLRHRPRGIGSRFHEGIDIAASPGTPIYAPGSGIVTFSGIKKGLGKTIVIDHGFGITSVYGHSSELIAKEGDRVQRGALIALVGRTGRSTGPHLHYQIEVDGVPTDPMRYIIENQ